MATEAKNPMASLADDADGEPTQHINGARAFGIVLIICGVAGIGLCVPYFQALEQLDAVKLALDAGNNQFVNELNLPIYIIMSGFVMIMAGLISIVAYIKSVSLGKSKSKILVVFVVILSLIGSAGMIFVSLRITTVLDGILLKLQSNPVADPTFTDDESGLLDMVNAVFNECCLEEYDSRNYGGVPGDQLQRPNGGGIADDNQRNVTSCVPGSTALSCPDEQFPDLIDLVRDVLKIEQIGDLLCTCINDQTVYDNTLKAINDNQLCEKFTGLVVEEADDRPVPTVSLTFGQLVKGLATQRPEYTDSLPMGKFAMVGKILPPESIYGEPAEDIGWSCGLGYAKGAAYQMYLFIRDTTTPIEIGGLAIGAIAGVFSLLLVAYIAIGGGGSEEDDFMYEDDNNMEEYKDML